MIEKIDRLLEVCSNDDKEIENNYLFFDTLMYEFEKLFEDSTRLSIQIFIEHPELPFDELRAIRNRVAHNYESVIIRTLIDTVRSDLPNLKSILEEIISSNY